MENANNIGKINSINVLKDADTALPGGTLRVGITGMGSKAGASFITLLTAEALAAACCDSEQIITVFSAGDAYYYDALGMDRRFAVMGFSPVETAASTLRSSVPVNVDENISWAVSSPKSAEEELSMADSLRILYRLRGDIILWDMKYEWVKNNFQEALKNIDLLIFVIDPLPSRMLGCYDIFSMAKECGKPVIFVINKMNEGVNRHELYGLLKIKKPVIVPFTDSRCIYASEYSCENPYRDSRLRKSVIEPVGQIVDIIEDIRKSHFL